METANETTVPNKSRNTCIPVKFNPNLISFKKLAPNIAGIARKNVNSAATPLDTPMRSAPHDRRSRTGCSGDQRQCLKYADDQNRLYRKLRKFFHFRLLIFLIVLDYDKQNTVDDQCRGNNI